jgi:hypothetical protein
MSTTERILAKHRQARMHMETLQGHTGAFVKDEPYKIEGSFNGDCTEYVFRATEVKEVPEIISLLAGDVLHNARACLDHLAWEIAKTPTKVTAFPMKTKRPTDKNGDPCEPTISGGISAAHQRALASVQPYEWQPGWPDMSYLALLSRFDNSDKHRLIITSWFSSLGNYQSLITGYRGAAPALEFKWGPIEKGDAVATVRFSEPNPHLKPDYGIFPGIAPQDPDYPDNSHDIADLLDNILRVVSETVTLFEPF